MYFSDGMDADTMFWCGFLLFCYFGVMSFKPIQLTEPRERLIRQNCPECHQNHASVHGKQGRYHCTVGPVFIKSDLSRHRA